MHELHRAFARSLDIEHLELAKPLPRDEASPASAPGARRVDAAYVWQMAEQTMPEAVFLFADLDFVLDCAYHRPAASPRLVAYVPIDSPVEPSLSLMWLSRLDALAVYTRFARDSLRDALAAIGKPAPPIHIVPHGRCASTFFPLDANPSLARTQARAALHLPDDAFVVLNANRNQPRKRIDLTLLAFRRFLDLAPDANAKLYLHMGLRDRGIRVLPFAADLGIQDRLLLTGFSLEHPSVTDAHLNLVYNACDVGINTADAEGWGLIAIEHGATRKAQLVPAHTGCGEIWRGHAHLLPATAHFDAMHNRKAFEVDVDAAAQALAAMYRDEALRERYAALALRKVESHTPSWDEVGDRLAALIRPAHLAPPVAVSRLAGEAAGTPAPLAC